jgi:hypothetical protein
VRFQTADGRTAEFQNNIGTNAPPRVGDEVTVLYDPERPEDAKVALGDTFKINVKLLLVVGAMFLAVVAFMFLSVFCVGRVGYTIVGAWRAVCKKPFVSRQQSAKGKKPKADGCEVILRRRRSRRSVGVRLRRP